MQIDHKPTKILIVGKSGSGKSTYQIRYLKHAPYDRVFLFDHKLEFEHKEDIAASTSIDICLERLKQGQKYISYHHSEEYPGDAETAFQFYCEWVFSMCRAMRDDGLKSLFVCDEVNRFTSTSDMGGSFRELIEDGRLQGLDFCGTSHAANQISNRLRLQLTEIVALRTHDPRPLAFLAENGFDTEEVKRLPIGSFIVKNLDNDSFSRGKLFSCPRTEKELEPESSLEKPFDEKPIEPQLKETEDALPRPPANRTTVQP